METVSGELSSFEQTVQELEQRGCRILEKRSGEVAERLEDEFCLILDNPEDPEGEPEIWFVGRGFIESIKPDAEVEDCFDFVTYLDPRFARKQIDMQFREERGWTPEERVRIDAISAEMMEIYGEPPTGPLLP